jgi:putative spermidine/putrescine transport system permease protein
MSRSIPRDPVAAVFGVVSVTVLVIIVLPLVVTVFTAFNAGTVTVFPPQGWSLKWFANVFKQAELMAGLKLSLVLAIASSIVSISFGTLAAFALSRLEFRGREVIDSMMMSPLIVPQVIVGLSFLVFFVRFDGTPQFLRLLLLHSLLTIPYATRVVRASLARVNPKLEEAAVGLGASRARSFLQITLPQIRSGLFVAVFFCFVVSFDNFTATAFLASDGATLPVALYQYIDSRLDPTVSAIAALMMLGTTAFVLIADRMVGINRIT